MCPVWSQASLYHSIARKRLGTRLKNTVYFLWSLFTSFELKAGFHIIVTIAAIAGKNVQQSLRSYGNHFLAIVAITAIIPMVWNQTIWKLLNDQSRNDRSTFLVAIVTKVRKGDYFNDLFYFLSTIMYSYCCSSSTDTHTHTPPDVCLQEYTIFILQVGEV